MPRPFVYKRIHAGNDPHAMNVTLTLGVSTMYGIKYHDDWIIIASEDQFPEVNKKGRPVNPRKYYRPFLASKKAAVRQANKLNQLFHTDEYQVVEV